MYDIAPRKMFLYRKRENVLCFFSPKTENGFEIFDTITLTDTENYTHIHIRLAHKQSCIIVQRRCAVTHLSHIFQNITNVTTMREI